MRGYALFAILLWSLPAVAAPPLAPGRYSVDAARSEILLFTGRAGWLSALGHNHVMAVRELSGEVELAPEPIRSTARLVVPVHAIEIDAPALRAAAGEGFDSVPSEQDIGGTRSNMLGPAQLNATTYPHARVLVGVIEWRPPQAVLHVEFQVAGGTLALQVPAKVSLSGADLSVSGELSLTQSELGITPFQALGGALTVADEVRVRFRVVARRRTDH